MGERVFQGSSPQGPMPDQSAFASSLDSPVSSTSSAARVDAVPSAAVDGGAPSDALGHSAEPQRHYVHHSYIWLGALRVAGFVIVAIMISAFSSIAGMLFDGPSGSGGWGFGLFIAGMSIALGIIVVFAVCLLYQWWSYKHLWYEIGDEEFSLYSGIFNKKRVHVPYQRVQSVDQHASLWQRIFGVCTVDIDTAGGSAHTAVTVPYVRKDQAERLRMELYLRKRRVLGLDENCRDAGSAIDIRTVSGAPADDAASGSIASPVSDTAAQRPFSASGQTGNVLDVGAEVWGDMRGLFAGDAVDMGVSSCEYGLTNRELVFTGLSNNTGFVLAIIGVLATVFQVAGGVMDIAGDNADVVADAALAVGSTLLGGNMLLLGIVSSIVAVVVLWLVSVASTCIQFGGFRARRRGNRIEVEHGLLQHRIRGVDVDRVQSIVVKQSVVRRLLGYCELSLGKIDAVGASQGDQNQSGSQQGLVIHPFVKVDRVPQILDGIIPEFADAPVGEIRLAPVALRRAIVRRGVLQGAGFWMAVAIALAQALVNLLWHPSDPAGQTVLSYVNIGAFAAYAVCLIVFVLEVVGAVLWARGSGFAYNRRFMRVVNGGMAREIVSFPRRKIQFGYVKTNPLQRRASTATIAVRTAAGTGGTTIRLIDVCEDDARAWLDWVRPHANAL